MVREALRMYILCYTNGWADDSFRVLNMNKELKEKGQYTKDLVCLIGCILTDEVLLPGFISADNAKIVLNSLSDKLKSCAKDICEFDSRDNAIDISEYFKYRLGDRSEEPFKTWATDQAMSLHSKYFAKENVEKISNPPNTDTYITYLDRIRERLGEGYDCSYIKERVAGLYHSIKTQLVSLDEIYYTKEGLPDTLNTINKYLNYLPHSIILPAVQKVLPLQTLIDIACGCYPSNCVAASLECLDSAFRLYPEELVRPEIATFSKRASVRISQLFPKRLPFKIMMCLYPFNLNLYTTSIQNADQPLSINTKAFWQEKVIKYIRKSNTGLLMAWRLARAAAGSSPLHLKKLGLVEGVQSPDSDTGFSSDDLFLFVSELHLWLKENFTPRELDWKCSISETACNDIILNEHFMNDTILFTQGLVPLHPELTLEPSNPEKKERHNTERGDLKRRLYSFIQSERESKVIIEKQNTVEYENDGFEVPKIVSPLHRNTTEIPDPRINILSIIESSKVVPPLPVLVRVYLERQLYPEMNILYKLLPSTLANSKSPSPANPVSSPSGSPRRQPGQPDMKTLVMNGLIRGTLLNLNRNLPTSCRYVISFKKGDSPVKLDLTAFPRWLLITEVGDFWIDANPAEDSYLSLVPLTSEEMTKSAQIGLYTHIEGLDLKPTNVEPKRFKPICTDILDSKMITTLKTNKMILVPCLPELSLSNQFYLSTHLSGVLSRPLARLLDIINTDKLNTLYPVEKPLTGNILQLASCLTSEDEHLWISDSFKQKKRNFVAPRDRPKISPLSIVQTLSKNGLAGIDQVLALIAPTLNGLKIFSSHLPRLADIQGDYSPEYLLSWNELTSRLAEEIVDKLRFLPDIKNPSMLLPNIDATALDHFSVVKIYLRRLGSLLALCVKGLGRLPFSLPPSLWLFILGRSEIGFTAVQELCPITAKYIEDLLQMVRTEDPRLGQSTLFFSNPVESSPTPYITVFDGSMRIPLSQTNFKLYIKQLLGEFTGKIEEVYSPLRDGFYEVLTPAEIACETLETVQAAVSPITKEGLNNNKSKTISSAFQRSLSEQMRVIRENKQQLLTIPLISLQTTLVPTTQDNNNKVEKSEEVGAKAVPTVDVRQNYTREANEEEGISMGGLFD